MNDIFVGTIATAVSTDTRCKMRWSFFASAIVIAFYLFGNNTQFYRHLLFTTSLFSLEAYDNISTFFALSKPSDDH